VDKINDKFMARMEKKQHDADEQTVQDAAHVNQLFGGSFSDGVGSNTWAHTPYQKYDYKDTAHMQSLAEVSPEKHAELVKCMQLAQAFKGAKAGHFKVTEAQLTKRIVSKALDPAVAKQNAGVRVPASSINNAENAVHNHGILYNFNAVLKIQLTTGSITPAPQPEVNVNGANVTTTVKDSTNRQRCIAFAQNNDSGVSR